MRKQDHQYSSREQRNATTNLQRKEYTNREEGETQIPDTNEQPDIHPEEKSSSRNDKRTLAEPSLVQGAEDHSNEYKKNHGAVRNIEEISEEENTATLSLPPRRKRKGETKKKNMEEENNSEKNTLEIDTKYMGWFGYSQTVGVRTAIFSYLRQFSAQF